MTIFNSGVTSLSGGSDVGIDFIPFKYGSSPKFETSLKGLFTINTVSISSSQQPEYTFGNSTEYSISKKYVINATSGNTVLSFWDNWDSQLASAYNNYDLVYAVLYNDKYTASVYSDYGKASKTFTLTTVYTTSRYLGPYDFVVVCESPNADALPKKVLNSSKAKSDYGIFVIYK